MEKSLNILCKFIVGIVIVIVFYSLLLWANWGKYPVVDHGYTNKISFLSVCCDEVNTYFLNFTFWKKNYIMFFLIGKILHGLLQQRGEGCENVMLQWCLRKEKEKGSVWFKWVNSLFFFVLKDLTYLHLHRGCSFCYSWTQKQIWRKKSNNSIAYSHQNMQGCQNLKSLHVTLQPDSQICFNLNVTISQSVWSGIQPASLGF